MTSVLLVVHLLLTIAMVIVILLQRSEGGALGIGGGGGGGMGGFMTGRSAANLLTRTTAVLAGAFMLTSLALSLIANSGRERSSILDQPTPPAASVPAPETPSGPVAPLER